jgi:hypothetical protein
VVHRWSHHAEIGPAPEIVVDIVRWAADATCAVKVGALWLWYIAFWTDLIGLVPGARPEARLLPVENRRQALPLVNSSRSTRPRSASAEKGRQRG